MAITRAGASVGASSGADQDTFTFSITVPAGTDCLVVLEDNANGAGGVVPLGITFGGVALTKVPSSNIQADVFESSIWYLLAPAAGTANVIVDVNSDASQHSAAFWGDTCLFLTGVDQTTPVGTAVTNSGATVAGSSITIAGGVAGDLYLGTTHIFCTAISSGGSQTLEAAQTNIGGLTSASGDSMDGAGSGVFTWTGSGTTNSHWTSSGVVFKASSSPPTTEQEGFLFRNDNGSETTATSMAAQDSNVAMVAGSTFRLRTLVNTTNDLPSSQFTLEYSNTADSKWRPIS